MEDEKRLIDANKLGSLSFHVNHADGTEYRVVDWDDIEAAPIVDAVEVVRCKDCKKYRDPFCLLNDTQSGYLTAVSLDHFCSYGERRCV